MRNLPSFLFHALFSMIVVGELIGRLLESESMDYVFKPLILLSLMIWFTLSAKQSMGRFSRYILIALFFSWLGDIFLMFQGEQFFIIGLGSFLLSHVFYSLSFWESSRYADRNSVLRRFPWLTIPFLLFGIGMYAYLFASLGDLKIPVLVYTSVIALMAMIAFNRLGRSDDLSFRLIFGGAVLFMISDASLAINLFVNAFTGAGVVVMSTYMAAQYLIVRGAIRHIQTESVLRR
jgi:uncharacterized membrane protein YhhN